MGSEFYDEMLFEGVDTVAIFYLVLLGIIALTVFLVWLGNAINWEALKTRHMTDDEFLKYLNETTNKNNRGE